MTNPIKLQQTNLQLQMLTGKELKHLAATTPDYATILDNYDVHLEYTFKDEIGPKRLFAEVFPNEEYISKKDTRTRIRELYTTQPPVQDQLSKELQFFVQAVLFPEELPDTWEQVSSKVLSLINTYIVIDSKLHKDTNLFVINPRKSRSSDELLSLDALNELQAKYADSVDIPSNMIFPYGFYILYATDSLQPDILTKLILTVHNRKVIFIESKAPYRVYTL